MSPLRESLDTSSRTKQLHTRILGLSKILVAVVLLVYLLDSGRLDFSLVFISGWASGMAVLLTIQLAIFLLSVCRWHLIVEDMGLPLSYRDCALLSWAGQFFAVFLPPVISTDASKMFYLRMLRIATKPALVSLLADRSAAGAAMGILLLAALISLFLGSSLPLFILFLASGLSLYMLLARLVEQTFSATVRGVPPPPPLTVAISLLTLTLKTLSILYVITLLGQPVDAQLFFISIVGLAFELLPLTPANLGVGHVAFDRLYELVERADGANVYNFYFLAKILFKLSGAIGWVLLRRPSGPGGASHASRPC